MSGFLWRSTVRNVNRAMKEINAFEWEGDYRPAARGALKKLLEGQMEGEFEAYLGRGRYERLEEGDREDYLFLRTVFTIFNSSSDTVTALCVSSGVGSPCGKSPSSVGYLPL